MNAVFLTLFFVAGANPVAAEQQVPYETGPAGGCVACDTAEGQYAPGCGARGCAKALFNWGWDWFGPMPQTCYQPRFGCYPGNSRDIHRYPAFHGYYYREPYNYRHYFDYPWHAQPHEPLGFFSYQRESGAPEGGVPVEAPVPAAGGARTPGVAPAIRPASATQSRWQPARSRTAGN